MTPSSDATWTAVPTLRPSSSSDDDECDPECRNHRRVLLMIKLVAGIGGSVAVLVIVLGVLWYRRRRVEHRRTDRQAAERVDGDGRMAAVSGDGTSGCGDDKSSISDLPPPYEGHAR